jgi:hypothetical protein
MPMSKKAIILCSVIFVVGSLSSYRFGIYLSQKAYSQGLKETQAILAFNRMKLYRKLTSCIENGKYSEANEKLRQSIITQRELLARFLNSMESEHLNEYIKIRSKENLESFKHFKSNRGSNWSEPSC